MCVTQSFLCLHMPKEGCALAEIARVRSQDNSHYCNDTHERAVIEAEGSPMGPLIRAVNYIADQLAAEFPTIAVDTLCARAHHHQPSRSIRCCVEAGLDRFFVLR